jgi:hypothetical protein
MVFLLIFTNFISTLEILLSYIELKSIRLEIFSKITILEFHFQQNKPPTCPLRPIIPNNTSPPCITAAAGTELAGTSFASTVIILLAERALHQNRLQSLTRYCWIKLSPIVQYSPLLPPIGVWAVFQSQCG